MLVIALAAGLITSGCGGSSEEAREPVVTCTPANARELAQNFITASSFDVECVTTKTGKPFYFVNNDDASHTVTTETGAPESFDAELPRKTSTYAHTFQKPGTYKIICKRHNETMTLIVTS